MNRSEKLYELPSNVTDVQNTTWTRYEEIDIDVIPTTEQLIDIQSDNSIFLPEDG